MHSNDARHEPSIVQNGFFTQGLSHWFGSFLRHRWVPTESGDAAAKYHAEIYPERLSAYPDGIRAGINQFLDLPELFTYPSRRVASLIRLRGLGNSRFLLDALPINIVTGESPTLLNGRPLVEGNPLLPGKAAYFQHPFLYRDLSRTVSIQSGEQLQIIPFNQDATIQPPSGFRAGPLIIDKSVASDQEFAAHILTASADGDLEAQLSSERDFPGVTARVANPVVIGQGSIGQGNLTFEGNAVELMRTFVRTDGRGEGIKLGDTISFGNGVTVLANSDGVTIDDGRYQVQYKNLDGATGVSDGGAFLSTDWAVYPEVTVDVTYGMPLYQYEFTLAYSYSGVAPDTSRVEFLGLGPEGTISSLGTVVETIPATTSERVDFAAPNESWIRRFEHIVDEFVEPVAGRAYLNIPPAPPVFDPSGETFPVDQVFASNTAPFGQQATDDQLSLDFNYTERIADAPGLRVTGIDAFYDTDVANEPVLVPGKYVITYSTNTAGNVYDPFYLVGYLHTQGAQDFAAGPWVRNLLALRGPFQPAEDFVPNAIVIQLSEEQDTFVNYNGSALTLTDEGETILTLTDEDNLEGVPPYIQVGDLVKVSGDFAGLNGVSRFDPVLEADGLRVLDVIADQAPVPDNPSNPSQYLLNVTIRTERPATVGDEGGDADVITNGDPNNPGPGSLQLLVASSTSVRVGNVSLWRGYRYHRLPNTDTADTLSTLLGADLSIDPLNKTALAEDTVFPKGAVVLYAGGGACPAGYTPLRGEAGSNTPGLANVPNLPLPLLQTNIIYDEASDTTTLRYPGQAFDQLDDQGDPIGIPNTTAVFTVPLFGLTDAYDDPIYRQVRVQRFRQQVEPGMILRVPATTYEEGSAPLVTATDNDITSVDVVGPTANADRGHLVVDVQPILRNDGASVSDTAQAIRFSNFPEPYESHRTIPGTSQLLNRYGNGFGSIQYPSVNPAYIDYDEPGAGSQYPQLFPQGPRSTEQTVTFPDVFPDPDPGDAAWPSNRRVGMLRTNSIRSSGVRLNCTAWRSDFDDEAGYNETITIPELGAPIWLNNSNNAFATGGLTSYTYQGQNQRIQGRDVLYARWYQYSDGDFILRDSFLAIVTPPSPGSVSSNIYRYDRRKFADRDGTLFDNEEPVGNSVLILHPAKFYGAPGVKQILASPPPGQGHRQPIGKADGMTQARLSLEEDKVSWVTENPQTGIEITLAGRLGLPAGMEELLVEPSGYLRYGNKDNLLDYGASGHTHRIEPNTELTLSNPIPRLHRAYQARYFPVRLPVEHGHGSFDTLRFPLPAAELFGLCIKL